MKYNAATQRNEVLIYSTTRMSLENMLHIRSETQKVTYHMIPFICNIQNRQIHGYNTLVVARGWEKKGIGSDCLMGTEFQFG